MSTHPVTEAGLCELIASCTRDPLRYVTAVYPWGEGELAGQKIRNWQADVLREIGTRLQRGESLDDALRIAVASGHGIGKSALVSWCIMWALDTCAETRVVVTANTGGQLANKTWPELRTWHRRSLTASWWVPTATALYSSDSRYERTWRADAIPWSEHNTEAFAGLHNRGRRILLVYDEASAIHDAIWEVSEGALTDADTEKLWLCFGNPTRNAGRFREAFGARAHRWTTRQIDSRTVEGIARGQLDQWVQDYGEDSDFVRVRVRGVFPRAGVTQLIASDVVAAAAAPTRAPQNNPSDPVIVGVDVARYGQDESVIAVRKGRDARTVPMKAFRGLDTMQLAAQVALMLRDLEASGAAADAVFVDETGVGGGVIDRLRQLGFRVTAVNNAAAADQQPDGVVVRNKGAEQWVRMRNWLGTVENGAALPTNDPALTAQLESREYFFDDQNRLCLEKKEDMAKRGLSSPDRADALALTFAYPVSIQAALPPHPALAQQPYDPLGRVRKAYDPLARVRR